jgi:hypothetical protein
MARPRTRKTPQPKTTKKKLTEFELGYKTAIVETFHEFRRGSDRAIHTDNTKPGIAVLEAMATILSPNAGVAQLYTGGGRKALIVSTERKIELWDEVAPYLIAIDSTDLEVYKMRLQRFFAKHEF